MWSGNEAKLIATRERRSLALVCINSVVCRKLRVLPSNSTVLSLTPRLIEGKVQDSTYTYMLHHVFTPYSVPRLWWFGYLSGLIMTSLSMQGFKGYEVVV